VHVAHAAVPAASALAAGTAITGSGAENGSGPAPVVAIAVLGGL
jgi:hypothetical protein